MTDATVNDLAQGAAAQLDALADLPGVVAGVTTASETVYLDACGPRTAGESEALSTDAVLALYSVTKSLTATLALQLAQDGALDLDAPSSEYAAELADLGVLDGFDESGTPLTRPVRSAPTLRQLLTHTAGFAYTFLDEEQQRVVAARHLPDIATAKRESLDTPMLFEPGSKWEYGVNLDWAGLVIEAATGRRLGEVMTERLLAPLGMNATTFARDEALVGRAATIHARKPDGTLKPISRPSGPDAPAVDMGGQGLYSTVSDFLTFVRLWLNDGRTDSGDQLLSPETIASASLNQLGELSVTRLPGINPRLSHDVEFFPGIPKGWNMIAMTNESDAPTGRPAGAMGWAGLANLYFWIDRRNAIGGMWATQLFPFCDPIAFKAAQDFESAVYRSL